MVVFDKPKALADVPFHYCPGCTHGIVHRLVAETMDELGVEGKAIGVAPVGCAVMAYDYFNCDMIEAAHGRAPAVATGIKRALPENVVFTYQGDGDPLPTFAGEPIEVTLPTPDELWSALNEDNKISLYCNCGGKITIYNKNLGD
jgi:hypothetical protein